MPVDSLYCHAEQEDRAADPRSTQPEAEKLSRELFAMRDEAGRWQKGGSGNPAGRPRDARNRATLMAEALLDAATGILTQKGIEKAISGDPMTLRFCLARLLAPRRSRPIELDLPRLDTQNGIAAAITAVGNAVAEGEVTSAEATEFARLIETAMQAIEKRKVEDRENERKEWERRLVESAAADREER